MENVFPVGYDGPVPIESILDYEGISAEVATGIVDAVSGHYAALPMDTAPPIIVDPQMRTIDGLHRLRASIVRKDAMIRIQVRERRTSCFAERYE